MSNGHLSFKTRWITVFHFRTPLIIMLIWISIQTKWVFSLQLQSSWSPCHTFIFTIRSPAHRCKIICFYYQEQPQSSPSHYTKVSSSDHIVPALKNSYIKPILYQIFSKTVCPSCVTSMYALMLALLIGLPAGCRTSLDPLPINPYVLGQQLIDILAFRTHQQYIQANHSNAEKSIFNYTSNKYWNLSNGIIINELD